MSHPLTNPTWWAAAGVRAIKTAAQIAVGTLTSNTIGITDVDWAGLGSISAFGVLLSFLTSLVGLPEVEVTDVQTVPSSVDDEV